MYDLKSTFQSPVYSESESNMICIDLLFLIVNYTVKVPAVFEFTYKLIFEHKIKLKLVPIFRIDKICMASGASKYSTKTL